jgi:glyoxylase-like metal-dependent hydrolase (beta-lactamase superfamily II)
MVMKNVSRRNLLKLAGMTGVAASANLIQTHTVAQEALPNGSGFYRFSFGSATITILSDGQVTMDQTFPNWGANPDRQAEFEETLRDYHVPLTPGINNFNPMLIETASNKVLIDTGLGSGGAPTTGRLLTHLQNAGVNAADIDTVFLTHGHPDHIQGLLKEGQPNFPNARLIMGEVEFNFWTSMAEPPPFISNVLLPLKDQFTLLGENQEIAPGISTVASPGHTPGHMAVMVDGGDQQLIHFGDAGGHFLLSLLYPEHYLGFDADPETAVATRAKLFSQAASEGMMVIGYHYPWPGVGHIRAVDSHYEYVPSMWVWGA